MGDRLVSRAEAIGYDSHSRNDKRRAYYRRWIQGDPQRSARARPRPQFDPSDTSNPYDEDNISTASASLDSVSSTDTLATSATAFSIGSRFSIEQIQNATQLFVSILQNDELLAPLYESARNNIRIGPQKLRRHVRGAIKTFAEQLEEEASDYLQHAASRLVQARAHYAARFIASGEDRKDHSPASGEPSDQISNDLEDSSEEETAERPADHTGLEDLQAFHLFLTGSDAYTTLQADIHAFCTKNSNPPSQMPIIDDLELKSPTAIKKRQKSDKKLLGIVLLVCGLLGDPIMTIMGILGGLIISRNTTTSSSETKKEDSQVPSFIQIRLARAASYLMTDVVFPLTDDLSMALGLLEPPLKFGWTRIRTECVCLLYDY